MEADAVPGGCLVGYRQCVDEAAPEAVTAPEPDAVDERSGVEPTGVATVDAALDRLAAVEGAPVEAHVQIFDDVQRQLHEALAELEE
jgi:hypothetical protein